MMISKLQHHSRWTWEPFPDDWWWSIPSFSSFRV